MKLYSPSSRQDYSFCPRSWWLRKQGWKLRQITYPELCAIGGIAVGEAMEKWNQCRIDKIETAKEALVQIGQASVERQLAEQAQLERRVTGLKDVEFRDALPGYVEIAINTLWDADPLKAHTIIAAEHTFKHWGNMRADVISKDPQGNVVVDDYKCKFGEFDVAWTDREFDKHFDGEQRLYYTHASNATLFGIILVLIRPHSKRKAAKPHVIRRVSRVKPEEVKLWHNDMIIDCFQMEIDERAPNPWLVRGKAAPHANTYGDCVYRGACVDDGLDPEKMALRYVRIEKGDTTKNGTQENGTH